MYFEWAPWHYCELYSWFYHTAYIEYLMLLFLSYVAVVVWYTALFSAMAHDIDHPGVNNHYIKATNGDLAVRYNDKSCLEVISTCLELSHHWH